MLEYYTEAVIADVVNRYGEKYGVDVVSVAGGRKYEYPYLIVESYPRASLAIANYTSRTPDGELILRHCDYDCSSILYGVFFQIVTASESEAITLSRSFISEYSDGVMVFAENKLVADETIPIFIKTSARVQKGPEKVDDHYVVFIGTDPSMLPKPYFFDAQELPRAKTDRGLQFEMLIAARYCSMCADKSISNRFTQAYKYVVSNKLGLHSVFGFEPGLKELHASYVNGALLEKDKFRAYFGGITVVLPDLYERAIRHEPYERTLADFEQRTNSFKARKEQLCDAIGLPQNVQTSSFGDSFQPRTGKALEFFYNHMEENPNITIDRLLPIYLERFKEVEAAERAEQAERDARRAAERAEGSSGGWIKQSAERRSGEKRCFWGTVACMMGLEVPGSSGGVGSTIHTCMQCPKYLSQCTGRPKL